VFIKYFVIQYNVIYILLWYIIFNVPNVDVYFLCAFLPKEYGVSLFPWTLFRHHYYCVYIIIYRFVIKKEKQSWGGATICWTFPTRAFSDIHHHLWWIYFFLVEIKNRHYRCISMRKTKCSFIHCAVFRVLYFYVWCTYKLCAVFQTSDNRRRRRSFVIIIIIIIFIVPTKGWRVVLYEDNWKDAFAYILAACEIRRFYYTSLCTTI